MPRYFFHFSDGRRLFTDRVGSEFRSLLDVRKNAKADARNLREALNREPIKELLNYKVVVSDQVGRIV